MTKDGMVERNEATGDIQRVSQRGQEFSLKREQPEHNSLTPDRTHASRNVTHGGQPKQQAQSHSHVQVTEYQPEAGDFSGDTPQSMRQYDAPIRPDESVPRQGADTPSVTNRYGNLSGLRAARSADVSHKPRYAADTGNQTPPREESGLADRQPDISSQDQDSIRINRRGDDAPVTLEHDVRRGPQSEKSGRLRFDQPAVSVGGGARPTQQGTRYSQRFLESDGKTGAVTPEPEIPPREGISRTEAVCQTNRQEDIHSPVQDNPQIHRRGDDAPVYFDRDAHHSPTAENPGRLRFDSVAPRAAEIKEPTQHGTKYSQRFTEGKGKKCAVDAGPVIPPLEESNRADRREARPLAEQESAPVSSDRDVQRGTQYYRKFTEGEGEKDPNAANTPVNYEENNITTDSGNQTDPPDPDSRPQAGQDGMPQISSKLQFSPEERVPDRGKQSAGSQPPEKPDKKVSRARNRMEHADRKLDAAREKLPTKRKPHLERVPDPDTGKVKRRLKFEQEVKSQREHIRGPLAARPVKAGANAAVGYVHRKMYEVEHENVGVEAAHKAELAVEGAVRQAAYSRKIRPYRRVSKLQRKASKARFKLAWRETLRDNPNLKKNALARMAHKRRIKKQYADAARNTERAARIAGRAGKAAAQAVKAIATAVKSHPAAAVTIIALGLLLIIMVSAFSSCSNMAMGGLSTVLNSSYTAQDADIDDAGIAYSQWETDLRIEIEEAESTHPGYDEYRYDVDEIGHDPFALMAYLTAKYHDFTFDGVEAELQAIFAEQYHLSFVPEIEVRYRTEYYTDDDGHEHSREVPYNWYILNIILRTEPFTGILESRMDGDQREHYDVLMDTHGNRQYIISPFAFNWLPYVSSYYGWRTHPITGARDFHTGLDIAVPAGTEILAGHAGVVASAGNAGDYGLAVVIAGEDGLSSRYAHCSALLVSAGQEVKKGDVIAKVGSTGASTGPHLHVEVILEGRFLNPLYFAEGAPA